MRTVCIGFKDEQIPGEEGILVWMLQGAQAHTPPSRGSGLSGVGIEEMTLLGSLQGR